MPCLTIFVTLRLQLVEFSRIIIIIIINEKIKVA